ncbi:hypothetical protein N7533_004829, partial [Penicillium manginii]|uniref:uncharacterized protein n=1 Tax=Penicillium manginii TaxID=203109 RepID=UPI0025493492
MPRIRPSTLIKAYQENPLLPLLLKECRTLESARNELRWLREHALRTSQTRQPQTTTPWRTYLSSICRQRSRGYPLQYILGDQPFGDLEILCRPGVLIPRYAPRPDTESYVLQAAKLVEQIALEKLSGNKEDKEDKEDSDTTNVPQSKPLQILDLCTGTGCITLLLHALLSPRFNLRITGIDISPAALSLARKNLAHNLQAGHLTHRASTDIKFHRADIMAVNPSSNGTPTIENLLGEYVAAEESDHDHERDQDSSPRELECDLLISNPPYISTADFRNGTTARSVRLFEPRLALVPAPRPHLTTTADVRPEDIFYDRILDISYRLRSKVTVLECGDIQQAERVVSMHTSMAPPAEFRVQIWPWAEEDMAFYGFHSSGGVE